MVTSLTIAATKSFEILGDEALPNFTDPPNWLSQRLARESLTRTKRFSRVMSTPIMSRKNRRQRVVFGAARTDCREYL